MKMIVKKLNIVLDINYINYLIKVQMLGLILILLMHILKFIQLPTPNFIHICILYLLLDKTLQVFPF